MRTCHDPQPNNEVAAPVHDSLDSRCNLTFLSSAAVNFKTVAMTVSSRRSSITELVMYLRRCSGERVARGEHGASTGRPQALAASTSAPQPPAQRSLD